MQASQIQIMRQNKRMSLVNSFESGSKLAVLFYIVACAAAIVTSYFIIKTIPKERLRSRMTFFLREISLFESSSEVTKK